MTKRLLAVVCIALSCWLTAPTLLGAELDGASNTEGTRYTVEDESVTNMFSPAGGFMGKAAQGWAYFSNGERSEMLYMVDGCDNGYGSFLVFERDQKTEDSIMFAWRTGGSIVADRIGDMLCKLPPRRTWTRSKKSGT